MAKVTMPLLSGTARGKIANAMVHFPWKGIAVVRQWLIPTNKKSTGQGDRRIMIGGTGRAVGRICPRSGSTVVSAFAKQLITLDLIKGYNTKQSYLVQYILDNFITGSTSYALELSAATHLSAYTVWQDCADAMQITEFDSVYAAIAPYDKTLGLYLIAKAAFALGFTGTPYTTNPTTWTVGYISGFINDFTNAT